MSLYTALEVAIGLALVYLILSGFCSAVNEWIVRWTDLRSRTLKDAIEALLQDPAAQGLAAEFHGHPLIRGLIQSRRHYATYLPPRTVAAVLADLAVDLVAPDRDAADPRPTLRVRETVRRAEGAGPGIPISAEARRTLSAILAGVEGDIEAVHARLGAWFDDSMERVSGWYKRKAQTMIVWVAVALTLLLRVDTVELVRQLWVDPTARAALVERASRVDAEGQAPTSAEATAALESLRHDIPLGWTARPTGDPGSALGYYGSQLLAALPGMFLTVVALSLGAPFWFDLLNKLVNLRQTGVPPDEAKPKPRPA